MMARVTFGVQSSPSTYIYSTNAICRQHFCINPLYPGFTDLTKLESVRWQCQPLTVANDYMQFCKGAVQYDIAVPSPNLTMSLETLIQAQDSAAATMYFYHLSGMNMEAWQYRKPLETHDPCVRSVWKFVCSTYFPRAQTGCGAGEASYYMRPCRNVCEDYLTKCDVRCCDESTRCVFEETVQLRNGESLVQKGYVNQAGPHDTCTGGF